MRLLHRKRERSAQLISVQRAMTGRAHPARAVARPVLGGAVARRAVLARMVADKAGTAWPEILRAAAEAAEAEAALEPHRAVRIAFAGGNGIAEAGDQHVADRDFGSDPLRGAIAQRNVHGRYRGAAVAYPNFDLGVACGGHLAQLAFAVVKA